MKDKRKIKNNKIDKVKDAAARFIVSTTTVSPPTILPKKIIEKLSKKIK